MDRSPHSATVDPSRRHLIRPLLICSMVIFSDPALAVAAFHKDDASHTAMRWWTATDGLPETPVVGLETSPDGRLVCLTRSRICWFDGRTFELMPIAMTRPLTAAVGSFRSLGFDAGGDLWILATKGVAKLSGLPGSDHADGIVSQAVRWQVHRGFHQLPTTLTFDAVGQPLLIGTNALYRFRDGRFQRLTPISNPVASCGWQDGVYDPTAGILHLWGHPARPATLFSVPDSFVLDHTFGYRTHEIAGCGAIHDVLADPTGTWVLGDTDIVGLQDDVQETLLSDLPPPTTRRPQQLIRGGDGRFYVFRDGTCQTLRSGERATPVTSTARLVLGPRDVFTAADGSIWAGCPQGLLRLTTAVDRSDWSGNCTAASPTSVGDWLVAVPGRIVRVLRSSTRLSKRGFSPRAEQVVLLPEGMVVDRLANDAEGRIWFSTTSADVYRVEGDSIRRLEIAGTDGAPIQLIHDLTCDATGTLWVGCGSGLLEGRPSGMSLSWVGGLTVDAPTDVLGVWPRSDGSLLLVTQRQGVLSRTPKGSVAQVVPPDRNVCRASATFHEDAQGTLWIGGEGGLLGITAPGGLVSVGRDQGLLGSPVQQIREDGTGRLWVAFQTGSLQGVRVEDLHRVALHPDCVVAGILLEPGESIDDHHFLITHGHPRPLAANRATREMIDGSPDFASRRGLISLVSPPRPMTTPGLRVRLVETQRDPEAPTRFSGWQPNDRLIVMPSGRSLQMQVASRSFLGPPSQRLQTRMLPFSPVWSSPTSRMTDALPQLGTGDYTIDVRELAGDSVEDFPSTSLILSVLPPWWQTWPFFIVSLGCLFAVAIGITWAWLRYRFVRIVHRYQEQNLRHEERSRIARDLHDTLGAGLTSVAMLSDIARRRHDDQPPDDRLLEEIFSRSQELVRTIDDVVWTVDPRNDLLQRCLDRIEDDLARLCRDSGQFRFACQFQPGIPAGVEVPSWIRHHVSLACREAARNAVRHSGGSLLRMDVFMTKQRIVLSIQDDGQGFDPAAVVTDSHGLENMRDRMASIGGSLDLETQAGSGTTLRLYIPLACLEPTAPRPATTATPPTAVRLR